jgi:riboflavin kinase/FMN adenylyltransferase
VNIINAAADLPRSAQPVCLAIGVFDGVHLGHQQVIRQMVTDARQHEGRSIVITFDRHPNSVVAPDRVPAQIYSLPQKLRAIEGLGVEATLLIRFDKPFSQQSGEEFIRGLARGFGRIHSICVGSAFTFGHKRSGNVEALKKLGQELGFVVHGLAAVSLDGEVVSSTRIREAIRAGHLDSASQMLGRAYSISGLVVRGDGLGRQLGFPTANINATGLVLPPAGVYAVHLHPIEARGKSRSVTQPCAIGPIAASSSRTYRGALNIGFRPTLASPAPQLQVEAHLLDFTGDLYGQELEIAFVEKIRDEQKFASLDVLKSQIALDIATLQKKLPKGG